MKPLPPSLLLLLITLLFTPAAFGQQARPIEGEKARPYPAFDERIEHKQVTIWSDGTRMAGDLYLPKDRKPGGKLPAIVFVNGTGGVKKRLPTRIAPRFVKEGYVFLAFDFRGWGESDSKLQLLEPMPNPDQAGDVTVKARAIRWQMDFADQVADIHNVLAFLAGEPEVDWQRIGLLGTSYGGGLVTWVAANDPRVRCAVAQVPGMGGQKSAAAWHRAYVLQTQQARGEVEPVPYQTGKPGGNMSSYAQMRYNHAKSLGYNVIEEAEKVRVPMMILDAGKEELMDISKNGGKVAEILRKNDVPVTYHVFEDMAHYGIYRDQFDTAIKMELGFFDQHLKNAGDGKDAGATPEQD